MSLTKRLEQIIEYVSDAVIKIFSPSDDEYPATGVQPFEGKISKRKNRVKSQDR